MIGERTTTPLTGIADRVPLEAAGVRLRLLVPGDAEDHRRDQVDPQTLRWAYTREEVGDGAAVAERIAGRYRDEQLAGHALRLAITDPGTGEYLGLLVFFDDRGRDVEVGFTVSPDARGRGVAQRTLAAAAELARRAGYTCLRARTDVDNHPARRTLVRAGYAEVGDPRPPISPGLDHVRLQAYTAELGPADTSTALRELLERLLRETGVPGAQATIVHRGTAHTAAAGVLSVRTGLEVSAESIFQIGSITKLFTTVLVLQLVDEGLIALDDPVADNMPEFRLADPETTAAVRIADLLQHRGGFDGDYFTDGGRGTDAPRALIAALASAETFFPPGTRFAYSNAGMVVLGRLVEVLRGADYLTCVRERIYRPLGLEHAVTLPEEAILHPVAVGHTRDERGAAVVTSSWQLPMSAAATGAALTMSADDLARFGAALLGAVTTTGGAPLLRPETARLIGTRDFALPVASSTGEGFGLGAFTFRYDGATAFGHDGQTIGQVAGLRIVPEADLVIAIVTNRENTTAVTEQVIDFALRRFCGARVVPEAPLPDPPLPPEDRLIAGFYANHTMTATVTVTGDRAHLMLGSRSIDLGNQPAMRLHRVSDGVYRVTAAEHGVELKFRFIDSDGDGTADLLWFNRMLRRAGR